MSFLHSTLTGSLENEEPVVHIQVGEPCTLQLKVARAKQVHDR
jgi:hypothetical protein